jgi:hypothetical protein
MLHSSWLCRRCGTRLKPTRWCVAAAAFGGPAAWPALRRVTGGGHLFGIILSYGTIELLAAMVMRANTLQAAGGSESVRALRSRRMLLVIYRSFCVTNC